jgi:hypothetical protein
VIDVPCDVYWASLHVADDDGEPLSSVQVVIKDLATGAVLGFATTNASGEVKILLPGIAIEVEVYWRGELVRKQDDLSLEDGDISTFLSCQVYRVTIKVVDKDGHILRGVPVVLADAEDMVVSTSITDAKGQVVFQVGTGVYDATAHLTTTYRWTEVGLEEAAPLDVNGSGTWTLEFKEYPPGVMGTVQFWTVFGVMVLFLLLLLVAWTYWRSLHRPPPAPPKEDEEDEVDEGEEGVSSESDDEDDTDTGLEGRDEKVHELKVETEGWGPG